MAGRISGLIGLGETVTWEAGHFGIRQRLTVRVTALERPYHFSDEMISGAFASMKHSHRFLAQGTGTLMRDGFHFTGPLGWLGRTAEWLFLTRYLTRFPVTRNQALKALAESGNWPFYLPKETED